MIEPIIQKIKNNELLSNNELEVVLSPSYVSACFKEFSEDFLVKNVSIFSKINFQTYIYNNTQSQHPIGIKALRDVFFNHHDLIKEVYIECLHIYGKVAPVTFLECLNSESDKKKIIAKIEETGSIFHYFHVSSNSKDQNFHSSAAEATSLFFLKTLEKHGILQKIKSSNDVLIHVCEASYIHPNESMEVLELLDKYNLFDPTEKVPVDNAYFSDNRFLLFSTYLIAGKIDKANILYQKIIETHQSNPQIKNVHEFVFENILSKTNYSNYYVKNKHEDMKVFGKYIYYFFKDKVDVDASISKAMTKKNLNYLESILQLNNFCARILGTIEPSQGKSLNHIPGLLSANYSMNHDVISDVMKIVCETNNGTPLTKALHATFYNTTDKPIGLFNKVIEYLSKQSSNDIQKILNIKGLLLDTAEVSIGNILYCNTVSYNALKNHFNKQDVGNTFCAYLFGTFSRVNKSHIHKPFTENTPAFFGVFYKLGGNSVARKKYSFISQKVISREEPEKSLLHVKGDVRATLPTDFRLNKGLNGASIELLAKKSESFNITAAEAILLKRFHHVDNNVFMNLEESLKNIRTAISYIDFTKDTVSANGIGSCVLKYCSLLGKDFLETSKVLGFDFETMSEYNKNMAFCSLFALKDILYSSDRIPSALNLILPKKQTILTQKLVQTISNEPTIALSQNFVTQLEKLMIGVSNKQSKTIKTL